MEVKQVLNLVFITHSDGSVTQLHTSEEIKKYYGDQNHMISTLLYERVVFFEDNKLTFKINTFTKERSRGKKYFRKRFNSHFFRFDLTTGNFLTVTASGTSKKKRNQKINTNSFHKLTSFFNVIWYSFSKREMVSSRISNGLVFDNPFENFSIIDLFNNVMGSKMEYDDDFMGFENIIIDKFIEIKGIKVPNKNYRYWLGNFYPTEKYLKKNDRKLLQSILDMFGMKSGFMVRFLHDNPNISSQMNKLVYFHKLLGGTRYMSALSKQFPVFLCEYEGHIQTMNKFGIMTFLGQDMIELKPNEKSTLVKLLNNSVSNFKPTHNKIKFGELVDHFEMLRKIRKYDDSIVFKATTEKDFHREHIEFSKMVAKIRKGSTLSYIFDDEMVHDIEKPIHLENGSVLYPHLLKSEVDYIEEGKVMHHCVGSYYDKKQSVIVSLRNEDGTDRVTTEYDVRTGEMVQSKHFFNKVPPELFSNVIDGVISKKCKEWSKKKKLMCVGTKSDPLMLNGKPVIIDQEDLALSYLPF